MIISFAWTKNAVIAEVKTVTRRFWTAYWAKRFPPGSTHVAYDKVAFHGGKPINYIRIVEIREEPLERLFTDDQYAAEEMVLEGDLWPNINAFRSVFRRTKAHQDGRIPFRVQFEYISEEEYLAQRI